MSSDVALPEPPAEGLPADSLVLWAQEARQAHQIATSLAETSFVPKAMQHKPEEVTGAILAGRELGLSPIAALRSIDIIDGTPAMRAHGMRGLVQSHGHEIWVEESTESRAIVCGRRRSPILAGRTSSIERSTWTMDRARKAGLAGKRNWQAYPAAMLIARATAEVCRLIAADVLLGMPYAVEELEGGDPRLAGVAREVEPVKATKGRTLQRRPALAAPAAVAEPAVPEAEDSVPIGEVPMAAAQRKALFAEFRKHGIDDRSARLRHASRILDRPVTSFSDLTAVDAGRLFEELTQYDEMPDVDDEPDVNGDEDWPPVTEPGAGGWA